MKFEFSADRWQFILEATPDPNYRPDSKFLAPDQDELDSWRAGHTQFHQLVITSNRLEPKDNEQNAMIHYCGGILLSLDEQEAQEELECILDQEGILEHILKHWELQEDLESVVPEWAQV